MTASAALAGALVPARRRIASGGSVDRAARHLAQALGFGAAGARAAQIGPNPSIPMPELLRAICGLTPDEIVIAPASALRARVRASITDDYRCGRIERRDGWWISVAEARSLDLSARLETRAT